MKYININSVKGMVDSRLVRDKLQAKESELAHISKDFKKLTIDTRALILERNNLLGDSKPASISRLAQIESILKSNLHSIDTLKKEVKRYNNLVNGLRELVEGKKYN